MKIQQFSPWLDKVMAQEIQLVKWSKTMDVCEFLYVNNQLEICRVSKQFQRMLIIQEDDAISNIILESIYSFVISYVPEQPQFNYQPQAWKIGKIFVFQNNNKQITSYSLQLINRSPIILMELFIQEISIRKLIALFFKFNG